MENAISNLEFGGWKIWGGNLGWENAISNLEFGVWKIWGGNATRNSNLGGGWKIWVESRISNLGGGKFGVENAISNLEFGGVENLWWKMLSRNF